MTLTLYSYLLNKTSAKQLFKIRKRCSEKNAIIYIPINNKEARIRQGQGTFLRSATMPHPPPFLSVLKRMVEIFLVEDLTKLKKTKEVLCYNFFIFKRVK